MTTAARHSDNRPEVAVTTIQVADDFGTDVPAGGVLGTPATSGARRLGVDVEARMSIDHGALRLRPLAEPGWGREGIAYGPFPRRAGLALAALVLNGHNASQTVLEPETPRQRARRVLSDLRRGRLRRRTHFENLAVGWFDSPAPRDPIAGGNGFVMHAVDGSNGELWATATERPMAVAHGVQNLQILYVVVLRDEGAAYYAASVDGASGLGAHPHMRPLGIDSTARAPTLYAGVHQRILGEVGYRVDTRVHGVRVADAPELSRWYGTAHVADVRSPLGRPVPALAEVGGVWGPAPWVIDDNGLDGAVVDPGAPSGLVHALIDPGADPSPVGLLFRAGAGGAWRVLLGRGACELSFHDGTRWEPVRRDVALRATTGRVHALQVLDDGLSISVYVDGRRAFGEVVDDARCGSSHGVGITSVASAATKVRRFEAHPRSVPVPESLDMGAPWSAAGDAVCFEERFDGPSGELHGATTPSGGRQWQRNVGAGSIRRTGCAAARVDAEPARPNPGRTVYTVPWEQPSFVDVTVTMTPPGTDRHQGHEFRGGLVLWQDHDNYVVLNLFLDNVYDGSSISTFYRLGGHEDMYDAVWSLVGPVRWGVPCTLRVVSDGEQFLAHLDGQPVLHRGFRDVYPWAAPLEIRRIGIVANEEWGDDTGTEFRNLVARGRAEGEASS